jgi:hypothetical protein
MQSFCNLSAIPLFDRRRHHSFVPADDRSAAERSLGQHQPRGRRDSVSPSTETSPLVGVLLIRRASPFFALFVLVLAVLSMSSDAFGGRPNLMADARARWSSFVAEAAQRFSIPMNWIWSVMRIESEGDAHAVSPKGAIGLMQLMPRTYIALRARHHLGADPFNPHDNILAGSAYLREMYDRYGSPGFLAAYNAGPQRYEAPISGSSVPPSLVCDLRVPCSSDRTQLPRRKSDCSRHVEMSCRSPDDPRRKRTCHALVLSISRPWFRSRPVCLPQRMAEVGNDGLVSPRSHCGEAPRGFDDEGS